MPGYRLATPAKRDLAKILEYQLKNAGGRVAMNLEAEFRKAFRSLVGHPGMGHKRQDLTPRAALFFLVGQYLLVYRNEPDAVVFFAILHRSRDVKAILSTRVF